MKRIMPLAVALGALLGCTSAQANTYTPSPSAVDSTSANGQCSLRDAIEAANGTPLDACPSTPGAAATILLAPGAYHLVGGHLAELKITQSMTIAGGGGGSTTISKDDHLDRVFEVAGTSPVVTISGVTITGGHADNGSDNSGSPFVGYVGNPGGGILSAGTLTLDGVTVTGNSAGNGGAGGINGTSGLDGGVGGAGGGIAYTGSLTLRNSTVSNNAAGDGGHGGAGSAVGGQGAQGGYGGGIACYPACTSTTITGSLVTGNSAGSGGAGGNSNPGGAPGWGAGGGHGGGVYAQFATTISSSTISGNHAGNGATGGSGGASKGGFGGSGGGIYHGNVSLSVSDSVVSGNSAGSGAAHGGVAGEGGNGGGGGGIATSTQIVTITRSTVSDNTAGDGGLAAALSQDGGFGGDGGGILLGYFSTAGNPPTSHTITDSTVSGNGSGNGGSSYATPGRGGFGGGIQLALPDASSISNSTVVGNATGNGGNANNGAFGAEAGWGGGIAVSEAAATLTHLTVSGNATGAGGTGPSGGGGRGGGAGIGAFNVATIRNIIVASNSPANCGTQASGAFHNDGGNVSFGDTTCPGSNGNPLLAPLADNGGPTKTMALGEGSSAIDIVTANCQPADQRGVARPQRAACDAGAFELAPLPAATTQLSSGSNDQPPSVTPAPDKTPPTVKLVITKQKLRKALKNGYLCFFRTNEVGSASASFGKSAKGKLKITKTGKQKLVLKFTKKAKKAFAKKKKVTLKLTLVVKDAAGNATKKTAKVTLKR